MTAQLCPIRGYKTKTMWSSVPNFPDHVRKTLLKTGQELGDTIKTAKSVKTFKAVKSIVQGCNYTIAVLEYGVKLRLEI
ncbi:hypothetical protein CFE70_004655 [Pyrenophora teres f. teres 0-1]